MIRVFTIKNKTSGILNISKTNITEIGRLGDTGKSTIQVDDTLQGNGDSIPLGLSLSYKQNLIHLSDTTIDIATAKDSNNIGMSGKSIVHDNTDGATITVTANADPYFICEGCKTVGNLLFVADSGITLIKEDLTPEVNGSKGSSYRLRRISATEFSLSIKNI